MSMKRVTFLVILVIAIGIGGAVAWASFFGSTTVADFLGPTGRTLVQRNGHVETDTLRNRELILFGKKDTSVSPAGICGTVDYKARRDLSCNHIHRFQYEVMDPDVGTWTTVLDVTEPDSRISNPSSGDYNTFYGSYSHANASRGLKFRARIWESSADTNPMVMMLGFSQP